MIWANLSKAAMVGILSISATDAVGQPAEAAPVEERSDPQATQKDNAANGESSSSKAERRRAWLGVDLVDTPDGVRIASVVLGSPASKAGLRPGDQIVSIDGADAPTAAAVARTIGKLNAGDDVTIEVDRNGQRHDFRTTLEAARFDHSPLPRRKAFPHWAARPSAEVATEVKQLRQRIESLEKQVESLRRQVSELRDRRGKAGSDKQPQEKPDKLPPAGGAIDETEL